MQVKIIVTVDIDLNTHNLGIPSSPVLEIQMREAAREAIENAVRLVYENGFNHAMEENASIGLISVNLSEEQ